MWLRVQSFRLLIAALSFPAVALALDADAVARQVLPDPSEMVWQALEWHPTLWDAVIEAHVARKPVLLWAMNGHPLGQT